MVFPITKVTFLVTHVMNKVRSIVIPTYFLVHHCSKPYLLRGVVDVWLRTCSCLPTLLWHNDENMCHALWYITHPNIFVMWYCHRVLKSGWRSFSKWQWLQHCKSIILNSIYNEWQIMLGLHIVLATLTRIVTI
jgi:hypothetical protein